MCRETVVELLRSLHAETGENPIATLLRRRPYRNPFSDSQGPATRKPKLYVRVWCLPEIAHAFCLSYIPMVCGNLGPCGRDAISALASGIRCTMSTTFAMRQCIRELATTCCRSSSSSSAPVLLALTAAPISRAATWRLSSSTWGSKCGSCVRC